VDNASIEKFILKWKNELRDLTIIHLATKSIDGLALKCSESDWDNTFNVNLKGNFLLTKSLLPIMMNNSWGRIIQISSIVAANGDIGTLAYSSSKAGLRGFSNVLSKEYGRFNITSNILTLGYFNVGLINTLNEDKVKTILKKIPSGKLGHVKNIANAIKFIIDSDYLNGAYISIDGGI
jgi:NAD(P)-dependent dehydrogenase (short-subunit alcohol dehydrogenase family)